MLVEEGTARTHNGSVNMVPVKAANDQQIRMFIVLDEVDNSGVQVVVRAIQRDVLRSRGQIV
jgi:hypothetical protein